MGETLTLDQPLSFDESVRKAQDAERRVFEPFLRAGCWVRWGSNDARRDFEAIVQGASYRIEVKDEDNQAHTGNVCIETYQGNPRKPSGILTSESNLYVHVLGDWVAAYRTQSMRVHLGTCYRGKERDFGKADNFNGGFIVPIEGLEEYPWFDRCFLGTLPESPLFPKETPDGG